MIAFDQSRVDCLLSTNGGCWLLTCLLLTNGGSLAGFRPVRVTGLLSTSGGLLACFQKSGGLLACFRPVVVAGFLTSLPTHLQRL